eukprot:ANDGO_08199.mRNA.1 hypothetical protein H310_10471
MAMVMEHVDGLLTMTTSQHPETLSSRRAKYAFVYLHGFPDLSILYPQPAPPRAPSPPPPPPFASRYPRKLSALLQSKVPECVFTCFNGAGLPGSRGSMLTKTLVDDLADVHRICMYVQHAFLSPGTDNSADTNTGTDRDMRPRVCVIGVSTGALLAMQYAILHGRTVQRAFGVNLSSVVCIACVDSMDSARAVDFSASQIAELRACGSTTVGSAASSWRIGMPYYESYSSALDPSSSIQKINVDVLLLHGSDDHHVPWQMGKALFDHLQQQLQQQQGKEQEGDPEASEERARKDRVQWKLVQGATHFFSSTRHFAILGRTILDFIFHHVATRPCDDGAMQSADTNSLQRALPR